MQALSVYAVNDAPEITAPSGSFFKSENLPGSQSLIISAPLLTAVVWPALRTTVYTVEVFSLYFEAAEAFIAVSLT